MIVPSIAAKSRGYREDLTNSLCNHQIGSRLGAEMPHTTFYEEFDNFSDIEQQIALKRFTWFI